MEKHNTEFLERLKRNDLKAQRELFRKFNSRIFLFFRNRIKGEENYEDLVQEVFTSFFAGIAKDKVQDDLFIAPYIFGIAKRVVFNYFYKKKRSDNIQRKAEENFEICCEFKEDERLENEKLNEVVTAIIDKLPEVDKVILKEFYLKENNIQVVAGILGKTKHYISVRKERALKKLKSEILKKKDVYTR